MTHRNDDKASALATLTGSTGHVDDLEKEWLLSAVTTPASDHVTDLWDELFVQQGYTTAYDWLGSLGYTGALPDRWKQYWAAGGGGVTPAYDPGMMTFDGSTGYYSDTFTTSADSFTVVSRINRAPFTGGGVEYVMASIGPVAGKPRTTVWLVSSDHATPAWRNKIIVYTKDVSDNIVCQLLSKDAVCDSNDHTIFLSYNGTTGEATFYVDGVENDDLTYTSRSLTSGTLDSGASANIWWGIWGATFYGGDIGYAGYREAYLTNPTDFHHPTNGLQELDELTWTEWGAQPSYWNQYGTMTDNKGSAGNMTAIGTITGPA